MTQQQFFRRKGAEPLFEGFGTSLAWWANVSYPKTVKERIIELLFGDSGLQMNIVRYNLGGGHNENVVQNMRPGGCVPCIQNKDGTFDLNNDSLQLSILNSAVKKGVNKVELFCNSPPWWMTESGLTNGNTKAWTTNLKSDYTNAFVNYLVDSYKILSKLYPVVSIEPFNEPSNPFWSPKINQEGCYYNYWTRNTILKQIKKEDSEINVVGCDESHSLFAFLGMFFVPNCVKRLNIHGYNSFEWKNLKFNFFDWTIWRTLIKWFTSKPIWMSEYGMGYPDTIKDSLQLARHIFRDLETLEPTGYIYWQAVENFGSDWGLLQVDFNDPKVIIIKKQYYIFKHFTRTLKEGDTYKFLDQNVLQITDSENRNKYIILNDTNKPIDIDVPGNTFTISDDNRDFHTSSSMNVIPSYSIVTVN
jgi:hypothetical protein